MALAKWRRAVDMRDNAEEALPHMPTARATTAPVSIYDLVHTGSNQPTDSADEANNLSTALVDVEQNFVPKKLPDLP
jgi:hypothetical protein